MKVFNFLQKANMKLINRLTALALMVLCTGDVQTATGDESQDLEKNIYNFVREQIHPSYEPCNHHRTTTTSDTTISSTTTSTENFSTNCPQSNFTFKASENRQYIKVKNVIPDLKELTLCALVQPALGNVLGGTVLSYFNLEKKGEAFWMAFEPNGNLLHVHANGHVGYFGIRRTTFKFHLCLVISSKKAVVFANGNNHGFRTRPSTIINGSGTLIFGQRQKGNDPLDEFESDKAFSGSVENLMVWNRSLTIDEINMMYENKCYCVPGYLFGLTNENGILHGGVEKNENEI